MHPIYAYGTEAQRKKYLPKLAKAELVGCFGLTEPDIGSDPGSMMTRAEKVPGGYKLNGAKMWITNSPIADVCVVWAKLDGKIRGFIVERGTKGFSTPKIEGKLIAARLGHRRDRAGRRVRAGGQSAARTCRASPGRSAASTRRATASPGARWARPSSAGTRARQYTLDRKQFGRPLAANQLIQKKLADMQTEIALGLQRRAAARPHAGGRQGRAAVDLADEAQQLRQGARHRPRRPRHARRQRHLRRVPRHARHVRTSRRSTPTRARTTSTR